MEVERKKPKSVLDLLVVKSTWQQGPMATNEFGESVPTDSPAACRWCLLGAINYVYGRWTLEARDACRRVLNHLPPAFHTNETAFGGVGCFNDHKDTDFKAVRMVLRKSNI